METLDIATEPRGNAKLRKIMFGSALAILPTAVGATVGALARSRRAGIIAGGVTALGLGIARWQLQRSFSDEPDYVVEERIGDLEIRRYDARVEAGTTIAAADLHTALDRGFDRLAGYIFGANVNNEKLAMTTPVTSKYIEGDRRVSFMMPIARTAASLPAPDDDRIDITEVPPRRIAVLAFRGSQRPALVEKKEAELRRLVGDAGLAGKGEPVYAGFDPPWTLPFLRRNELWLEVI